jgi:hypothetical protein
LLFAAVIVAALSSPRVCASEEGKKGELAASLDKIASGDLRLQAQGLQEIREIRQGIIQSLISILKHNKIRSPFDVRDEKGRVDLNNAGLGAVQTAIELLGEFRATEAIDTLIENITFFHLRDLTRMTSGEDFTDMLKGLAVRVRPGSYTPDSCATVRALVHIGTPSVPAALRALKSGKREMSAGEVELLSYVIGRIEGTQSAIALLEGELAAEASQPIRDRLRQSIEYLRSSNPVKYQFSPPYYRLGEASVGSEEPNRNESRTQEIPGVPKGELTREGTHWFQLGLIIGLLALVGVLIFLLLGRRYAQ